MNAVIINESPTPAEHIVIELLLDFHIEVAQSGEFTESRAAVSAASVGGPAETMLHKFTMNWSPPGKMPVWNTVNFRVANRPVKVRLKREIQEYAAGWRIHTPGSETTYGFVRLLVDSEQGMAYWVQDPDRIEQVRW